MTLVSSPCGILESQINGALTLMVRVGVGLWERVSVTCFAPALIIITLYQHNNHYNNIIGTLQGPASISIWPFDYGSSFRLYAVGINAGVRVFICVF